MDDRQSGGTAGAVFALVLIATGITAAIDRFGSALPLPVFLSAVPAIAAVVVAWRARSLGAVDILGVAAGRAGGAPAVLVSALALVAAPIGFGLGGGEGFVLLAAFLAGGAIAMFSVAPALARTGAATVAGAMRDRYGRGAGWIAAGATLLALMPLLAAEAALAGQIGRRMIGLDAGGTRALVVAMALVATLAGGCRSALAAAAAMLPVVALAYLLPVTPAPIGAGDSLLPFEALFDARTFASSTTIPPVIAMALAALLVGGLAALPILAVPAAPATARRSAGAFGLAAAIVLAAPAYALHGRIAGIEPAANPAGLVLNFAAATDLGAAPALLLAGGLLAAALLALALGLSAIGATVGLDVFATRDERSLPPDRRAFLARLAMILAALLLVMPGEGASIAGLAALGLSFSAAGLAPVLLVGWNLAAADARAITASMAAGLGFVSLDAGLPLLAPGLAGSWLGMGPIAATVLGPTGWLGLPGVISGAPGALIGLAVLLTLARPWRMPTPRSKRRRLAAPSAAGATVDAVKPRHADIKNA